MKKNKDLKNNKDTIKILYGIMVALGIISFVLEFDLIECFLGMMLKYLGTQKTIYIHSFNMLFIKNHLQHHGDFYENLAMGGLASAFIAVVAAKVIINNYKKESYLCYKLAAQGLAEAYRMLIFMLRNFKNINQLQELDESNQYFKNKINEFLSTIEEFNGANEHLWTDLKDISTNTFMPLYDDINAFLSRIKDSIWYREGTKVFGGNEFFYLEAWQECVGRFYAEIKEKYQFKEITLRLSQQKLLSSDIGGLVIINFIEILKAAEARRDAQRNVIYNQLINHAFMSKMTEWETFEAKRQEQVEKEKAVKEDSVELHTSKSIKRDQKHKLADIYKRILKGLKRLPI